MRLTLAVAAGLVALALSAPAWAAPPVPGLVAAYGFDEGSGDAALDASGAGRHGAVVGASWAPGGRYGGALSFDGVNDYVGLPALGTFYNGGFTLEAWVQKTTSKNDVGIVGTWAGDGPMLWVDHIASRYHLTLGGSMSGYLDSGQNPATGQWQHLAATFDGATARFYIDGTEVSSRTVSGAVGGSNTWRIGAYGSVPGQFFDGLIDEIRIYDRALSAAEVQADRDEPVAIADPEAPTQPGALAVTGNTHTSVTLGWTASTDDVGVAGYNVFLDGTAAGTTTATSFTVPGLTCSNGYLIQVEAFDGDEQVSPRAAVDAATATCGGSRGLVAGYAFDEGAGANAADVSGNGHTGTITGAAWTTGRHGGGLSFDGSDDHVALGALGTFYNSGFTLEAWVRKASAKKDVGIVGTWAGNGPMLWVDHLAGHNRLTLGGDFSTYLDSTQSPAVDQWQHLAATFDGTTARYYVDGVQVASAAFSGTVGSSNSWRIGAYGSSPGGFLDGLVDDVRIYNRALSAGEIYFDRIQGVTAPVPDTTPPGQPGTLAAAPGLGQATLTWGAASDDAGVTSYNVHRSTTSGFTPSAANRIAEPTGTTYLDAGLATAVYHYVVTAEDEAGNIGPASNQAIVSVVADTTPPTVSITNPAAGSTISGISTVTADVTDDFSVAGVQFRVDGDDFGVEDLTPPYSVEWDTRAELNGSHTLTAVARDGSGNSGSSVPVVVTASNAGVSPTGLRVAYALDEMSGSLANDSSGNGLAATAVGPVWTPGHFNGVASLDGFDDRFDLPDLGTFYRTGFTYEAWVRKQTAKKDVALIGAWSAGQHGGAMIWVDYSSGRYLLTLGNQVADYLDSGRTPTVGQWEHVAATYDGATARFYIDGVEVASRAFGGDLGSSNAWRIGAYNGSPTGFFDGLVDNVRVYDRALSPAEIQVDMSLAVQKETVPPTLTTSTPADGATDLSVGSPASARFNEPLNPGSVNSTTFKLEDAGSPVPATVSYDEATHTATLTPQSTLAYNRTYTATVKGGSGGMTDVAGNALASSVTWSFTTEASAPQVLLLTSTANPMGSYMGEILRNEGLNLFTTMDVAFLSPVLLSGFDAVVLGEVALSPAQVSTLTSWVEGGGNLVAMRPSLQLAGLLGLTVTGGTRPEAYLRVDSATPAGAGIVDATIQYHGTADLYTLSGATAVATLYSNATTATSNPAVTWRAVGSNGGEAAAFTFDLARSVVYTRQGNPAWAGQERDGVIGIRPDDMFYGAAAGDPQPDWVDRGKVQIPQADEQQRLLANLITLMNADKTPLPRFWYLPRGEKAVVVMSGDDHGTGGTSFHFDRFKELSAPGCNVAEWQCVRSTSYIYTETPLTNTEAAAYVSEGFEVALHPQYSSCPPAAVGAAELSAAFESQLSAFTSKYTSLAAQRSSRVHCVFWPDWDSTAKVELALGMRMDANYYHYPAAWLGATPGFLNGGGFPMRFAEQNGTPIDVYQSNTNMIDEGGQAYPATADTLLDNALGAPGFYGAFGANMHTDLATPHPDAEAIVAAAQARDVPVINYEQLLEWTDGRNASRIRNLSWSAGTLTFTTTVGGGANGLMTMVPAQGPSGTLSAVALGGSPVPYSVETIKGIQYAFFTAASGTYTATYS